MQNQFRLYSVFFYLNAMKTAGYSGTPLAKKLGMKAGFVIKAINQPPHYLQLFDDLPEGLQNNKASKDLDFIHFFTQKQPELLKILPTLKPQIKSNGMIWVSWPKKSSGVKTDVTEETIRQVALKNGLVDVKVCAIDEVWPALKLVIPVKDRKEK